MFKLNRKEIIGSLLGLFAILFASSSAIFGKLLTNQIPVYIFLAISQVILVIILLAIYGLKNIAKELKNHSNKEILILIIVGILLGIIGPLLYYTGLQKTSAVNTILIGRMEPVLAGIIGILRIGERFSFTKVFSMVIMFFGVSVVVTKGYSDTIQIQSADILIVGAALIGAFCTNTIKKYLKKTEEELMVFMRSLAGGVFFGSLYPLIFNINYDFGAFSNKQVIILVVLYAIFIVYLADLLWFKALKKVSVSKLSLIALTYPIFGIFFSWSILGEKIFSYHIYGLIIILIGLILGFVHKKKFNLFHSSEKLPHT